MGRYLLLVIGAATLGVAMLSFATKRTSVSTEERRIESEEMTLARHAAESGYSITTGSVARAYGPRTPVIDVEVVESANGTYDAAVTATGRGPLELAVLGHYSEAIHKIVAERFPISTLPAPLVVSAEELEFKPSGSRIEVRGADRRQPGALAQDGPFLAGPSPAAPSMTVSDATMQADAIAELDSDQRDRFSGTASAANIETAALPPHIHTMYAEALATGTVYVGDRTANSETIGAPGSPAVLVIEGKVELKGATRGYGLLVVKGDFKMSGTARWEGIVLVQTEAGERVDVILSGDARIVGSLVLYGVEDLEDDAEAGLPGGHFDVDVFTRDGGEMKRAYHKHEYDDSYNVTHIDVIGGIGVGEHWDEFKSDYAGRPLRLELFNTVNGSGTLQLASPAGTYSVPNCTLFTTTIIPNQVTVLRPEFVDLQQLRGTSPGSVRSDDTNRDGSYSIRIFDGTTLVYEVSAYEHTDKRNGSGCGTTPGTGMGTGSAPGDGDVYGRFKLELKDRSGLYYSEEAIAQVGFALPSIEATWRIGGVVLSSSSISP